LYLGQVLEVFADSQEGLELFGMLGIEFLEVID